MPGLFLHSRPTRMSSRLDDSFARSKRDHRVDLTFPFGTILRILPTIRVFHRSTKRIIEKRGSIKRLDTLLRFFFATIWLVPCFVDSERIAKRYVI